MCTHIHTYTQRAVNHLQESPPSLLPAGCQGHRESWTNSITEHFYCPTISLARGLLRSTFPDGNIDFELDDNIVCTCVHPDILHSHLHTNWVLKYTRAVGIAEIITKQNTVKRVILNTWHELHVLATTLPVRYPRDHTHLQKGGDDFHRLQIFDSGHLQLLLVHLHE